MNRDAHAFILTAVKYAIHTSRYRCQAAYARHAQNGHAGDAGQDFG
jgi:hypothetical protein